MTTRKRHSPEQVVRKLTTADRLLAEGKDLADVCRELSVSEATYHRWRNQFGGLKADDARRLKDHLMTVMGLSERFACRVVGQAEGVLQPLGEKVFPPAPAEKIELGADPGGHPENMPPSEVADRVQHAVTGRQLTDEQRQQVSGPLHWAMGLGGGLTYAIVTRRYPAARAGFGALFGIVLFAATHGSTLPAAGVQHPPPTMPKAWWIWEGGSHIVYAVTVDTAIRVLDRMGG